MKWFVPEAYSPQAAALLADHLGHTLAAPPHFTGEVVNALYRRTRRTTNPITPAAARQAVNDFLLLRLDTIEPPGLYARAYALAEAYGIPSIYDCLYVVAAELTGGDFWTADQNLINTLGAATPWVRFIGDYPLP